MKALVLGGMFLMLGAAVGCSSSDTGTSGSGGAGGDATTTTATGGEGGAGGAGSTTSTTSTVTGTTTTGTTTTSTGGGTCLGEQFFTDATCDTCAQEACCGDIEACIDDFQNGGTDCINEDGSFNEAGTLSNNLFACLDSSCSVECGNGGGGGAICDSGLAHQDEATAACLGDACCDEFTACTGDGSDEGIQACIDCLDSEAGGALCDDAVACAVDSGCLGGGGSSICDTGLSFQDETVDTCLGDSCCDEFNACIGDGSEAAVQACIDCVNANGGALCDDALACGDAAGCFG